MEPALRKPRSKQVLSLRDSAYAAIKHKIITCELKPGEAVSEAALSASLGIGRTPVHQAIDRLMMDGLMDVLPRKGVVVQPVSLDEIFQIVEVRRLNEVFCVRRAAEEAQQSEVAALEKNVEKMRLAANGRRVEAMMALDREFHALLSAAARNRILIELLSNLHDRSARFWFISLRAREHHERVCEQHAAILEGIRAQDPDLAERAMRAHIDAFLANVTRQL